MTYSIKDLFTYDRECSKYLVNSEGLSGVTFKSCMEYEMTGADAAAVINLFAIRPDEKELFEYMPEESR